MKKEFISSSCANYANYLRNIYVTEINRTYTNKIKEVVDMNYASSVINSVERDMFYETTPTSCQRYRLSNDDKRAQLHFRCQRYLHGCPRNRNQITVENANRNNNFRHGQCTCRSQKSSTFKHTDENNRVIGSAIVKKKVVSLCRV